MPAGGKEALCRETRPHRAVPVTEAGFTRHWDPSQQSNTRCVHVACGTRWHKDWPTSPPAWFGLARGSCVPSRSAAEPPLPFLPQQRSVLRFRLAKLGGNHSAVQGAGRAWSLAASPQRPRRHLGTPGMLLILSNLQQRSRRGILWVSCLRMTKSPGGGDGALEVPPPYTKNTGIQPSALTSPLCPLVLEFLHSFH